MEVSVFGGRLLTIRFEHITIFFISAPLINIKKTIGKMKTEISEMGIRIGVIEYSLTCAKVRERQQLQEDMNNTSNTIMF